MRVSTNVLALLGAATLAAASPTPVITSELTGPVTGGVAEIATDLAVRSEDSEALEKRQAAAVITILTAAGTAAATAAAQAAVAAAVKLIGEISDWNQVREQFTKTTVAQMASRNPNPSRYAATICYNAGYDLKNPGGMDGKVSVSVRSGPLHTNYDCFYMSSANAFWSRGDGGYANLALHYDNRCSFDSRTADLTCR